MLGEKSSSGVISAGGAKATWFKDSEGNILAIIRTVKMNQVLPTGQIEP